MFKVKNKVSDLMKKDTVTILDVAVALIAAIVVMAFATGLF